MEIGPWFPHVGKVSKSPSVTIPSLVKLSIDDIKPKINFWTSVVYGYVMGANPHWEGHDRITETNLERL